MTATGKVSVEIVDILRHRRNIIGLVVVDERSQLIYSSIRPRLYQVLVPLQEEIAYARLRHSHQSRRIKPLEALLQGGQRQIALTQPQRFLDRRQQLLGARQTRAETVTLQIVRGLFALPIFRPRPVEHDLLRKTERPPPD